MTTREIVEIVVGIFVVLVTATLVVSPLLFIYFMERRRAKR